MNKIKTKVIKVKVYMGDEYMYTNLHAVLNWTTPRNLKEYIENICSDCTSYKFVPTITTMELEIDNYRFNGLERATNNHFVYICENGDVVRTGILKSSVKRKEII